MSEHEVNPSGDRGAAIDQGDVGTDEATYLPKVGEKVNLTGPVRPAPEDPAQTLNLKAADADLVRSQGGYINAADVTPTKG